MERQIGHFKCGDGRTRNREGSTHARAVAISALAEGQPQSGVTGAVGWPCASCCGRALVAWAEREVPTRLRGSGIVVCCCVLVLVDAGGVCCGGCCALGLGSGPQDCAGLCRCSLVLCFCWGGGGFPLASCLLPATASPPHRTAPPPSHALPLALCLSVFPIRSLLCVGSPSSPFLLALPWPWTTLSGAVIFGRTPSR
jgi:hypothetical protein